MHARLSRGRSAIAVAPFVAVFLLTTACSGDDSAGDGEADDNGGQNAGEGDRDDYVAAFTDSFVNPNTTAEDRECMGEATVDVVGVEALRSTGSPDQVREVLGDLEEFGVPLDEATAGAIVDALGACVDLRTVLFGDEEVMAPEVRACIDTRITDDLLRRYMISTYRSADPEVEAEVTTRIEECRAR